MDPELNEIQNAINSIFVEKFKDYQGGMNLSYPCIPRISKAFLENRVVVVGQETNTWYRNTVDDLYTEFLQNTDSIEKNGLEDRYDKFIKNNVQEYPGKFWGFNRKLFDEIFLKPMTDGKYLSQVLLNLFSVEAIINKKDKYGSPTNNKALGRKIISLQKDLLFHVMSVLNPKLILLFTGPSLDIYVKENTLSSKELQFIPVDKNGILSEWHLAEIIIQENNHPFKNAKIFRSYHPSYFLGRISRDKWLQNKIIEKIGNKSNSAYYTETFVNAIKDYYKKSEYYIDNKGD